jgi:uncharacterized protein YjbI with pentapeptide repeats
MANDEHVAMLKQGVAAWNAWRHSHPDVFPDLSDSDLTQADLRMADLSRVNLSRAKLSGPEPSPILMGLKLLISDLSEIPEHGADLSGANLRGADMKQANLRWALTKNADLTQADLRWADLLNVELDGANLTEANLIGADLDRSKLRAANLSKANLRAATLRGTNLTGANLSGADLKGATLVEADLAEADLSGCRVFGVSAWKVNVKEAKQRNLIITPDDEPEITVDNIEVAQFVYLLLNNPKIRDVIDTIGKKGVLLLGRFTEGRIQVLERLREKLRSLGFVPMVFNFDKPETKDFTETVRLLANLSHFVIVDITNPRSAPLELQEAVPDYMVPFVPILEKGQDPFAMFVDLQNRYDWVLKPVIRYSSVDRLIEVLEDKIVGPAEAKFNQLLARRTKQLRVEDV